MSRREELRDLEKNARRKYEAKNYDDAMADFSNAIVLARKWLPKEVLPLLDQRVAVYVKLGNLEAARKDALAMVRTGISNGRGYLRCGQLHRLQDNPEAALNWYARGAKMVPKSDPLHAVINVQLEKTKALLDKKVSSTKARDPLAILPAELLQSVLAYLDYVDIVRALQVSKSWKVTLSNLQPLIDTVDLSHANRPVSRLMMSAALKRLKPFPKVILTAKLTNAALDLLRSNLERWRNYTRLEQLSITARDCIPAILPFEKYSLKSLIIETGNIQAIALVAILKACHSLVEARICNIQGWLGADLNAPPENPLLCPTLRTLKIGGHESSSCLSIYPTFFTTTFPYLQTLVCHNMKICGTSSPFDLSELSCLRMLKMTDCKIPWWPKLPSNLEVWDNQRTSTFAILIERLHNLGGLANLRFLRFHHTSPPPQMGSFLPSAPSPSITLLDLRGTYVDFSNRHFLSLRELISSGHLADVRELAIDGGCDIEPISNELASLSNLEVLSLTMSSMDGGHLIELIKRPGSRLRQISLINCHKISAETLAWARYQGLTMLVSSE